MVGRVVMKSGITMTFVNYERTLLLKRDIFKCEISDVKWLTPSFRIGTDTFVLTAMQFGHIYLPCVAGLCTEARLWVFKVHTVSAHSGALLSLLMLCIVVIC